MIFKRAIILLYIFIINVLLFSQDNKKDIIINNIEFNGSNSASKEYSVNTLPVKPGDVWDLSAKIKLSNALNKFNDLEYEIIEEFINESNINIIIKIKMILINVNDKNHNKVIVNKIDFIGLKVTSPKYLNSTLPVKAGSIWDDSTKSKLNTSLSEMTDIIEKFEIIEEFTDKTNVNLKVNITEKGSFILVPFFSYSNSAGFKPKLIFRDYNLFGYRKYLNSELNFIPTSDLEFFIIFKDPAIMNNTNFSQSITGQFNTSVINYYANVTPDGKSPRGIAPLGVINGNTTNKWNDECFYQGIFKYSLVINIPEKNIGINPYLNFDYKSIKSKDNAQELPIDQIKTNAGLKFNFPINTYMNIMPEFNYNYNIDFGKDNKPKNSENLYYTNGEDDLGLNTMLKFSFFLPIIKATIQPYLKLVYDKYDSFSFNRDGSINFNDYHPSNHLDMFLGVIFNKNVVFRNITHSFQVSAELRQGLIGDFVYRRSYTKRFTDIQQSKILGKKVYYFKDYDDVNIMKYNTIASLNFTYNFDVKFLINHHFKMYNYFFYRYNDINKFNDFELGKIPTNKYDGWVGLIISLKYELPLFVFNTNKILTKEMDKDYRWNLFWDFFIDFGLTVTDWYRVADKKNWYFINGGTIKAADSTKSNVIYTYKLGDYLYLYPALAIGTAIRAQPRFLPIEIELEAGLDVYKILKEKTIGGGNMLIKFSITDRF